MWNNDYHSLLIEWANLREQVRSVPLEKALLITQNFWDKAPICNPYIHITEPESWPSPWVLLADNCFCDLAKSLGICYTLILAEHDEVNSLHIVQTDNYTLVQVNGGQYYLNDSIGELSEKLEAPIKYTFNCDNLDL